MHPTRALWQTLLGAPWLLDADWCLNSDVVTDSWPRSRRSVRQLQYTATAVVLPAEMWLIVCSFLLRGDWGAPRLPDVAPGNMAWA